MLLPLGTNNYNDCSSNVEKKIMCLTKDFDFEKNNRIKVRILKEELN